MKHLWPEPAQWLTRFDTQKGIELSTVDKGRVEQLISAVRQSGSDRRQALTRLSALLRLGLLTPEQSAALGNALWSDLDEGSPPLPSEMPYRGHVLRNLPAPAYSTRWRTRFHADGGQCSSVMADSVPR